MYRRLILSLVLVPLACLAPATTHATSWAYDFVQFNGINYGAVYGSEDGRPLQARDLGRVFATVRFTVLGTPCEYAPDTRDCQEKDDEALSLPVGTPVYTVRGYKPSFRLAARRPFGSSTVLTLYDVVHNPTARHGADLLDVGGRVGSISIESPFAKGHKVLGTITRHTTVNHMVGIVLRAPLTRKMGSGTVYAIVLHMRDGLNVRRLYLPKMRLLAGQILVPRAFQSLVGVALEQH